MACIPLPAGRRENRLANALARGLSAREKLVAEAGGSLCADDAASEIGISKAAILKRFHRGSIVGWREERQPGLEEVLEVLNRDHSLDNWGRLLFFLQKNLRLHGKRPLDYLRENSVEPVFSAARAYVE
jgi:hypothetical protein